MRCALCCGLLLGCIGIPKPVDLTDAEDTLPSGGLDRQTNGPSTENPSASISNRDTQSASTDVQPNDAEPMAAGMGLSDVSSPDTGDLAGTDQTNECDGGGVDSGGLCEDGEAPEACSETCEPIECGDGLVGPGEECDDGAASSSCSADCRIIRCGNGRIDEGEECDGGDATQGCNDDCSLAICGNGVVDAGEECDEASETPTCSEGCLTIGCGNGRVDPGEDCDDGNDVADDACFSDCQNIFPEMYENIYEDPSLEGDRFTQFGCTNDQNTFPTWVYPARDELDGREAFLLWFNEDDYWIEFNEPPQSTTRFSIDLYVPEGYERRLTINLAENVRGCRSPIEGATIRHIDRLHRGNAPRVRVKAGLAPGDLDIEMNGSGVSDQWVTAMIELDPMSGRIRFWYGGVRFGHLQLNAPIQAQALRIQGKHDGNVLRSITPIGISNFRIESVSQ